MAEIERCVRGEERIADDIVIRKRGAALEMAVVEAIGTRQSVFGLVSSRCESKGARSFPRKEPYMTPLVRFWAYRRLVCNFTVLWSMQTFMESLLKFFMSSPPNQ
jgi:hypothetical protein